MIIARVQKIFFKEYNKEYKEEPKTRGKERWTMTMISCTRSAMGQKAAQRSCTRLFIKNMAAALCFAL